MRCGRLRFGGHGSRNSEPRKRDVCALLGLVPAAHTCRPCPLGGSESLKRYRHALADQRRDLFAWFDPVSGDRMSLAAGRQPPIGASLGPSHSVSPPVVRPRRKPKGGPAPAVAWLPGVCGAVHVTESPDGLLTSNARSWQTEIRLSSSRPGVHDTSTT
jgi:hypothetical protein